MSHAPQARPTVDAVTDRLAWPSQAYRDRARATEPTQANHDRLLAEAGALQAIEFRPVSPAAPPSVLRVASWNAERCKFIAESARLLDACRADLCLLSEVDIGMARSDNRHTPMELAEELGMGYAFGTEFVELGLGDDREMRWHAGEENVAGLHGNAVLTRLPVTRLRLIPLDPGGEWFRAGGQPDQRRIGGRMALAAMVTTAFGPLCCAAVHFESRLGPADRAKETAVLIERVLDFAGTAPIVLGGDFNTAAMPTTEAETAAILADPSGREPMFRELAAAGFGWRTANTPAATLRQRPDGTPAPPFNKIDWFFVRGLVASEPRTVPALDADGSAISDHDCITVEVTL